MSGADDYFRGTRERHALESLLRRRIDPVRAAAERPTFAQLFTRYVAQRRPSRKFRRLVRVLLLAGFGSFPLRYLRPVDYREAAAFIERTWARKFELRFFEFWTWAGEIAPLPPLDQFMAELAAVRGYPPRR